MYEILLAGMIPWHFLISWNMLSISFFNRRQKGNMTVLQMLVGNNLKDRTKCPCLSRKGRWKLGTTKIFSTEEVCTIH